MMVEGLDKTIKRIIGDPIHVGNRKLTPTFEITTFCMQNSKNSDSAPLFVGFIIKPVSINIIEGTQEWTINIANIQ